MSKAQDIVTFCWTFKLKIFLFKLKMEDMRLDK